MVFKVRKRDCEIEFIDAHTYQKGAMYLKGYVTDKTKDRVVAFIPYYWPINSIPTTVTLSFILYSLFATGLTVLSKSQYGFTVQVSSIQDNTEITVQFRWEVKL